MESAANRRQLSLQAINWESTTRKKINRALVVALPKGGQALARAMRYAVLGNAKRFRPLLCLATASIYRTEPKAIKVAIALELIHSYSLIHDDLPTLDDDTIRRGKPTCHIRFGEAIALIAGDALQSLAFEILSKTVQPQAINCLAVAAGAQGMCGGQALDIAGNAKTEAVLRQIHRRKTGAIICAAVKLGAQFGKPKRNEMLALTEFGEATGLLFQIADDILDTTKQTAELGKDAGSDLRHGKPTYTSLLGLATARQRLSQAKKRAHAALAKVDGDTSKLAYLCDKCVVATE